ncbi:hypothetical protein AV521_18990 [Streptomyces sp. IMTB 2501]|nr:hypothetical protein AV521_18990 [Streptomyces sp. IMTB 2501]
MDAAVRDDLGFLWQFSDPPHRLIDRDGLDASARLVESDLLRDAFAQAGVPCGRDPGPLSSVRRIM